MRAFAVWVMVMGAAAAWAQSPMFEYRGGAPDAWDLLDIGGDGTATVETDPSCPPGYGPEVLHLKGEFILLLARDAAFTEGVITVLYKENEPRREDADGVLLFRAGYDAGIAEAHNLKRVAPHLWFEQDSDLGAQFMQQLDADNERVIAALPNVGNVLDEWNVTGWIWQQIEVRGNRLRAKFWPAHEAEPAEWHIDTTCDAMPGNRAGIRLYTGDIQLAYYAVSDADTPIAPPPAYLHYPYPSITETSELAFTFFTHAELAGDEAFNVTVEDADGVIADQSVQLALPAGRGSHVLRLVADSADSTGAGEPIALSRRPASGALHVRMASASGTWDAIRTVEVVAADAYRERFAAARGDVERLAAALETATSRSDEANGLRVIRDAARAHLDLAADRFARGNVAEAEQSLWFALEALDELRGYKGSALTVFARGFTLEAPPPGDAGRPAVQPPEHGKVDFYSTTYQLRFGPPRWSAQSLVMGASHTVTLPWSVRGASPGRDFRFHVALMSPLGHRTVASSDEPPAVPTSQWQPGETYDHTVTLAVSPEDPHANTTDFLSAPAVLDEYHYLVVSVTDPETGANVLIGNDLGPIAGRPGRSFFGGRMYVSSFPVSITAFDASGSIVTQDRMFSVTVRNDGDGERAYEVMLSATTETGRVVYRDVRDCVLPAESESELRFAWRPTAAGPLTFRAAVYEDGELRTEATREARIIPDAGYVKVYRGEGIEQRDGAWAVPVHVEPGRIRGPYTVAVSADGQTVGEGRSRGGPAVVYAAPHAGYYDVAVDYGVHTLYRRLVATVVDTEGGQLRVNGEPFLIKGTNVHGMVPRSPAKTATMIRIMRDLGFNMWRGDYPAPWQVSIAHDMNTGYCVLAPFSVSSTMEVYGRQAGPPLATVRELSRLFLNQHVDNAGAIIWNSANEIVGDTPNFLESIYPVYKHHDPYNRPVAYANLFAQDYTEGQDAVAVNYYFGRGQRATSRQPFIRRGLEQAQAAGAPLFFCEFNSWYGAVHSTGVEAFRDLYMWGVERGMAGGFHYMDGDSDRHPGVFDDDYNTRPMHDAVILEAFRDVDVAVEQVGAETIGLRILNRRDFALRDVLVTATVNGMNVAPASAAEIAPGESATVTVELPDGVAGPAYAVDGEVATVSHHGWPGRWPFRAVAAGSKSGH